MDAAEREAALAIGDLLSKMLRRTADEVEGPYAEALRYWSRQVAADLELHRTRSPEDVLALAAFAAANVGIYPALRREPPRDDDE